MVTANCQGAIAGAGMVFSSFGKGGRETVGPAPLPGAGPDALVAAEEFLEGRLGLPVARGSLFAAMKLKLFGSSTWPSEKAGCL